MVVQGEGWGEHRAWSLAHPAHHRLQHFLPVPSGMFLHLPLSISFLICKLGCFMSCVTQRGFGKYSVK